jgi:DNA (cytosine-5)-methyltransferase 1
MDSAEEFTTLEWCAGYGGIQLGLRRAIPNMRTIAYSEIEAFACANLVAKMEARKLDAAPIWPDLKTFPSAEFHGKVDLLVAGYPCQPFSSAGKRGGANDPRHLWPYIRDAIRLIQPRYCFFENVDGHISLGLSTVLSDLEEDGYRATFGIFSAEECGAPHRRKRVFILAKRMGNPSSVRLCGHGTDGGEVTPDTDREKRRVHEPAGASALPEHEPQPEAMADNQCKRIEKLGREVTAKPEQYTSRNYGSNAWPARPGEPQYEWEPPRVVENPVNVRKCWGANVGSGGARKQQDCQVEVSGGTGKDRKPIECQTQPTMGGNPNGLTRGMDYAELCRTCDNRTDELRLLGNGIVPATAERAWRVLYGRL